MNAKSIILFFFLLIGSISMAQKGQSKGDVLFFEYNYQGAIREYLKEMQEKPLNNQQYINLAESYLKVDNFEMATSAFMEVYKRNVAMTPSQFNKMLLAVNRFK